MVDGTIMGGTIPPARLSDSGSPPPALPPSVMSTNPAVYADGVLPMGAGASVRIPSRSDRLQMMTSSQGSPHGSAAPSVLQSGVSETAYVHAETGYLVPVHSAAGPPAAYPSGSSQQHSTGRSGKSVSLNIPGQVIGFVSSERSSSEKSPSDARASGAVDADSSSSAGRPAITQSSDANQKEEANSMAYGTGNDSSGGGAVAGGGGAVGHAAPASARSGGFAMKPARAAADFRQSVIGPDGTGGEAMEQEDPFEINIPGPSSGPMNPPLQPKLFAALRASAGGGKRKLRRGKLRGASNSNTTGSSGATSSTGVASLVGARSARHGGAPNLKRFTQFHSIHSPKKCFDLMLKVLHSYGCSQVQDKSPEGDDSSSSRTHKIRFVKVQDDQPTVASVEIRQVDSELTAIVFKKRSTVDTNRFISIYDEVYKRFSAASGGGDDMLLSSLDD